MGGDEREEIAAAVSASGELGSRYDSAIAEGLVERIGDEIDKRVEARLRGLGQQPAGLPPVAAEPTLPLAQPAQPVERARGSGGGFVIVLVSLIFGTGATSVVVTNARNAAAQVVMVLLIWAAIAIINIAHARRR